jgi:hypothetical protein
VSGEPSNRLHHGCVSLSHPVSCPMGNGRSVFFRDTNAECEMTVKSHRVRKIRPPLRSSGQSFSWLQIRRPGCDSRHHQKKKVVGLERGPLSLVSTTEELLDRKVAAPV